VASSPAQLRAYRPSDFETLYRIDQICFPKGIAYGRFELKVYLRSEGTHCLIAETTGEIAGFILTELIVDEAHIITLDVLEDYRRHGIGSLLLSASEEKMTSRGGKRIILETATTNKAAIALWKKYGYRQLGTIEGYYGWGLDAFQMGKDLVAVRDLGAG
jgi:ribosomal-protein-alanine N-acetyltransferase